MPGGAGKADDFLAVAFAPGDRPPEARMRLVSADGEDVEIHGGKRHVHVPVDDDFVHHPQRPDQIDALLRGVQDLGIRLGLEDAIAVLDGHDEVVAQFLRVFDQAQVPEMK